MPVSLRCSSDRTAWLLGTIALLSVGIQCLPARAAETWVQATAAAPWSGREGHGVVGFAGRLWVIGGWPIVNDVWSSTDGASWTMATGAAAWTARYTMGAVVHDGRMWVISGTPFSGVFNDAWWSTDGANWSAATTAVPWAGRGDFGCVTFDGRMWVLGGSTSYRNDVWYSTNGAAWTQATAAAAWNRRWAQTAAVHGGRLWIMAGQSPSSGYTSDVWSSSDGISWNRTAAAAGWSPRYTFPAESYDGRLWMMGGADPSHRNDVWYTTDGASWTRDTAAASWIARQSHRTTIYNGTIWMLGGNATGVNKNDVWHIQSACAPPSISVQPSDVMVTDCTPATFTANAAGGALNYQWRRGGGGLTDGGHVSGATSATLTIDPVGTDDEGAYDVVVSNACGAVTSDTATMTLVWGGRTDCNANGLPDACEGGGDRQWIGPDGGLFETAGNWSPMGVPGAIHTAVLTNSGAVDNRCYLDHPGIKVLCSLTIGATGSGRQRLEVPWDEFSPRTVLQATGGMSITTGGDIRLTGGRLDGGPTVVSGGPIGSGGRIIGYGAITADLTNGGTVEAGDVRILDIAGNVLDNAAQGMLRATIASDILVQSPDVTQAGMIEIRPNASISFPAGLLNQPGATITLLGGALRTTGLTNALDATITGIGTLDGSLYNNGQVTLLADLLILGDVVNDGTITIQNGLLTVTGNLTGSGTIIGGLGGG